MNKVNRLILGAAAVCFMKLTACQSSVVEVIPKHFTDTNAITIIGNSSSGNKGLLDYNGPVYVHIGLVTDSSQFPNQWRYVKFDWGSSQEDAKAEKIGQNKWSYKIAGIRKYFNVNDKERVLKLAILFRSGTCVDTFCRVLRNPDKTDIYIPVDSK